jgi:hypothetical protein
MFEAVELSVRGVPAVAVVGVILEAVRSARTGIGVTVTVVVAGTPAPFALVQVKLYVVVLPGVTGTLPALAGVTAPTPLSITADVAALLQL